VKDMQKDAFSQFRTTALSQPCHHAWGHPMLSSGQGCSAVTSRLGGLNAFSTYIFNSQYACWDITPTHVEEYLFLMGFVMDIYFNLLSVLSHL
jgi:hypothetical protein